MSRVAVRAVFKDPVIPTYVSLCKRPELSPDHITAACICMGLPYNFDTSFLVGIRREAREIWSPPTELPV
jgi:hypothetical protein